MPTNQRFRRRVVAPALLVTGSAQVQGTLEVDGAVVLDGVMTVNARPTIEASSASGQFAGRATIAGGGASVVISTSAVKSDSIILMGGPILTAAVAAVTTSLGITSVLTIRDSGFFTIGWANGGNIATNAVDIPWVIYNAG